MMDAFDHQDLLDAIYALHLAFRRQRMEPPAIMLSSHDEGMRFVRGLIGDAKFRVTDEMYRLVMAPDSSVWREFVFYGVTVRWPAVRTALPNGGWEYA